MGRQRKASIGELNWITSGNTDPRYFQGFYRRPELNLGGEPSITSRHMLDCTDRIDVGRFTTLAGCCGTLLTHGIDHRTAKQTCRPIESGDLCLLGSNVVVSMGVKVADRTVTGAGSIMASPLEEELGLWVGALARPVRDLTGGEAYFIRQSGHVY